MRLFKRALNFAKRESAELLLNAAAFLTTIILSFYPDRLFAYSWTDVCEKRLVSSARMRRFARSLANRSSTAVFAINEFEKTRGRTMVFLGKEDRVSSIITECLDFMDISVHKADAPGAFLSGYDGKIDLLYVSSAIRPKDIGALIRKDLMSENGVILIDNPIPPPDEVQRGEGVIPYLIKNGFNPVLSNEQCVLVRNRGNIPKIIHQIWVEGDIPPKLKVFAESWKRLNPEWQYKLWTGKEMEDWVRVNYPDIIDTYQNHTKLIMNKANMFRYLVLAGMGGVYADMDMECVRPLNFFFHKNVKYYELVITHTCLYPLKREDTVLNAFIASIPKHPFWTGLIKEICKRLLEDKYPVLSATGTLLFEEFVEKYPYKLDIIYRRVTYPFVDFYYHKTPASERLEALMMLITRKYYPETCMVHYWHHSYADAKNMIDDILP